MNLETLKQSRPTRISHGRPSPTMRQRVAKSICNYTIIHNATPIFYDKNGW